MRGAVTLEIGWILLVIVQEDVGVGLVQFGYDLLAVLELHERGLQRLDGHQDLFPELVATHDFQGALQDVVAELIVDKLLHDEVNSLLEVLRLLCLVAKFFDDFVVVIWEGSLEDLVDVGLGLDSVLKVAHLRVQALLDNVAGELELAQSDEVLGNLSEDSLVLLFILKLDHVLYQIVAIGVLDQLVDVLDDVVGEVELLRSGALLEASLHDAAAVLVHADGHAVVNASSEDEVGIHARLMAAQVVLVLGPLRCLEDHQQ